MHNTQLSVYFLVILVFLVIIFIIIIILVIFLVISALNIFTAVQYPCIGCHVKAYPSQDKKYFPVSFLW